MITINLEEKFNAIFIMTENKKQNFADPYSQPIIDDFKPLEKENLKQEAVPKEKKYTTKKIVKKIIHKKKKKKQNNDEQNTKQKELNEIAEEAIKEENQTNQEDNTLVWLYNLVESSSNLMCVIENNIITYINHHGVSLLGFLAPEEIIGMSVFDMISSEFQKFFNEDIRKTLESEETIEIDLVSASDKKITTKTKLTYIGNGENITYILESIDISYIKQVEYEKKQAEKKLTQVVLHDELTGLPGQNLFKDRLDMALARASRTAHGKPENSIDKIAVLLMNIDKLTPINKTLGYEAGDHVLRNISARLATSFRIVDTIARAKGDGFWMVLEGIRAEDDAETVARRTLGIMYEDITYKGNNLALGCSIGISVFPEHGTTSRELVRNAHIALQEVKYSGGGFYRIYDKSMGDGTDYVSEFDED